MSMKKIPVWFLIVVMLLAGLPGCSGCNDSSQSKAQNVSERSIVDNNTDESPKNKDGTVTGSDINLDVGSEDTAEDRPASSLNDAKNLPDGESKAEDKGNESAVNTIGNVSTGNSAGDIGSNGGSAGNSNTENSNNTGGTGNGNDTGSSGTGSPDPAGTHTHVWVEETTTITHEGELIEAAWVEEIRETKLVCGCGAEFGMLDEWVSHTLWDDCGYGNYSVESKIVNRIPHEAVYGEPWTETVGTGVYKCSSCGVVKQN